jgi:hypothetical protein
MADNQQLPPWTIQMNDGELKRVNAYGLHPGGMIDVFAHDGNAEPDNEILEHIAPGAWRTIYKTVRGDKLPNPTKMIGIPEVHIMNGREGEPLAEDNDPTVPPPPPTAGAAASAVQAPITVDPLEDTVPLTGGRVRSVGPVSNHAQINVQMSPPGQLISERERSALTGIIAARQRRLGN